MPASFTVRKTDVSQLIRELKAVDKELFNEMRREFRAEIRPVANDLKGNIPGSSPISGFSRSTRISGRSASVEERGPYVWRKPGASIDIGSRSKGKRRGRYRTEPVVRIRFNDKRPNAGFSILETAGTRGANRLSRAMATAGYPLGDRGRFVIPQFYKKQPELIGVARRILVKYGEKVSKRLARRF